MTCVTSADDRRPRLHLDAGGDAPVRTEAREAWLAALDDGWADPARLHHEGRRARRLLDGARASLAADLGVRADEIRLAPTHSAALRAAVLGMSQARRRVGPAVVVSAVERAAVHAAAAHAADTTDGVVRTLAVDGVGRVDLLDVSHSLAGGARLVAVQHANGEVGTVQPLDEIAASTRPHGVPLLVDAGASVGHDAVPEVWDVLAADARDWGAPARLGILGVRARVRIRMPGPEDPEPWSPGGVDVPTVLAAAVALRSMLSERSEQDARRRALVEHLRARVAAEVPDVEVVGDPRDRLPHVVTFSCLYVDGEALLTELDRLGLAVGSGSACTSAALEPSHVLAAIGVLTHGNVRIALHRAVTRHDVDRFCDALPGAVQRVRAALGAQGL